MSDEVVIHANVRFDPTCKLCGSPFGKYVDYKTDYEGDITADAYGEYLCGTTLERLVRLPNRRLQSYGPDRTFDERLIEQSWSCKRFAEMKETK